MSLPHHLRSRLTVMLHDICIIPVAWILAYWLRFNLEAIPPLFFNTAVRWIPAVMVIQTAVFWYFGLYRGVWRFASIPDLIRIGKAVGSGIACILAVSFLSTRMLYIPRSVIPLYALLLFALLGGDRFIYRWLKDRRLGYFNGKRVLIVGAGTAAEVLVRDLLRQRPRMYEPIAIVDDNDKKQGREIHGIRVVGTVGDIPKIAALKNIELILIAIPSMQSSQMRRLVSICENAGRPFRTLPRIEDLVSGQVTLNALREVSIEDLLGRAAIGLASEKMQARISDAAVLVTGGGGSIGSELCRQLARLQPRRLMIADNTEFNLYSVMQELNTGFSDLKLQGYLTDVTDNTSIERLFSLERPQIVFHAAAYKHVPLLEDQLFAAVANNVMGTRNAALAALRNGCETFVLISSDKAVNPASVMGATKRLAELVCQECDQRAPKTAFITVRFGNVLDSAGSVVPLFRRQIRDGGPLTVTHPDVERFFMTLGEAAQLIIEAAAIGNGGETFVLDMGEPIKIKYLAEQMIRLSGDNMRDDIEIIYTGLRHGEKLREELFYENEHPVATENKKILLSHGQTVDPALVAAAVDELTALQGGDDQAAIYAVIAKLVPGFTNYYQRAGLADVVSIHSRRSSPPR